MLSYYILRKHTPITVIDDGRNNFDNAHMVYGYKAAWRSVVCVPINPNEFQGK